MEENRISISSKIFRIVIAISVVSLVITSALGVGIMMVIRSQSERALKEETENNLISIVEGKAALADAELLQYSDYARSFAGYMTYVLKHIDRYAPQEDWRESWLTDVEDPDGWTLGYVVREENVDGKGFEDVISKTASIRDLVLPMRIDEDKTVSTVYWGFENGVLIGYDPEGSSPPEGFVYDFTEKEWWSKTRENKAPVFTDIYLDGFGRGLTITATSPFYDKDGNFYGVLGVDALIENLYEETVSLDLGEGAYAFLVDNKGNVINKEGDAAPLLDSEGLDQTAADRLLSASGEVFQYNDVYYTSAKVPSTGWTLCLHMPEDLVLVPVKSIDAGIITAIVVFVVVFVVILIIAMLVLRRFSDNITEPIISLGEDAMIISSGNLDHKAEIRTNDEIGDLARNFNEMSASLKEYVEDVRAMAAEKERLGTELSIASRIQTDMLPSIFPAFPYRKDFDIYASMKSAKEVGGDFYDFFLIDPDHLGLVIADVSGKGVPAALFMAITKILIKTHTLNTASPAKVLADVNNLLCENNKQNLFVTVWLGILTLSTGEVLSADAGHEYPLVKHADGKTEIFTDEHYPPLATMEDNEYKDVRFTLQKGEQLFLYTDGVTDAKNNDGKRYHMDRLLAVMNESRATDPKEILETVAGSIEAFTEGREPFDDITMMCVDYKGK